MSEDRVGQNAGSVFQQRVDRRRLLRRAGAASLALGLAPYVATSRAFAASRTIKIGLVTPRTGPLAAFGEADDFTVTQMKKLFAKGLRSGGNTFPVKIIQRDAQSKSDRAATVAQSLILDDDIDLMLVGDTPDIVNPVADTCEANGVPCISSLAPWQPCFFGRQKNPAKPSFKWTYHFFWGLEDIIAVFLDMWAQVPTNKVVGAIWPERPRRQRVGRQEARLPAAAQEGGLQADRPGPLPRAATTTSPARSRSSRRRRRRS